MLCEAIRDTLGEAVRYLQARCQRGEPRILGKGVGLPTADALRRWNMMFEAIAKGYDDWRNRRYTMMSSGMRTGNWRNTHYDKDHTVKKLKSIEVGIFDQNAEMVEITMVDERSSRLQVLIPKRAAIELARALGDRIVVLDNEMHR